jgi:hypothetical protein
MPAKAASDAPRATRRINRVVKEVDRDWREARRPQARTTRDM